MLNENIKLMRQSRGLSQEELARELKVVRQTVSKWERGLSVPDSEMLISISTILETNVSVLLGETVRISKIEMNEDLLAISKKLEDINLQLVQIKVSRRKNSMVIDLPRYYYFDYFYCAILIKESLPWLGL